MDPGREADRCRTGPTDIERVGLGEHARVAVGRAQQRYQLLALRHGCAGHFDVIGEGGARRELHGAVVAENLLDRGPHERPVVAQALQLLGEEEKRAQAVADQVGRRLVAGDEQQHDRREQLGLGELVALFFGVDEIGEHVVGRVAALVDDEIVEVIVDDARRFVDLRELVEIRVEGGQ